MRTDKDGKISFPTFAASTTEHLQSINDRNLRAAFNILDVDGGGKVSLVEMRDAFKKGFLTSLDAHEVNVDNEFWDTFLTRLNSDKDGFIDFDEFKKTMLWMIDDRQCLDTRLLQVISHRT